MERSRRWLTPCAALAAVFTFYGAAEASTWTVVGTPAIGCASGHASVRLDNGQVLSTGGWSTPDFFETDGAETFAPNTGLWSPFANMQFARVNHAMVKLSNGDVLVVGEYDSSQKPEVYKASTGTA